MKNLNEFTIGQVLITSKDIGSVDGVCVARKGEEVRVEEIDHENENLLVLGEKWLFPVTPDEVEEYIDPEPVARDFIIRLHRSCHVNEVEIKRNKITRIYKRVSEGRITELNRIIRAHRIETKVDFSHYTEIEFYCDKE